MGEVFSVPEGVMPAVRAHAFARSVNPYVTRDAYGSRFAPAMDAPAHDVWQAALLARESRRYGAFRNAFGRSVLDVLTGPEPKPVFPRKVAEDDDSEAFARREQRMAPEMARAMEFCADLVSVYTEEGGNSDRVAIAHLHRLAVSRRLKGCPRPILFSQAVQRLHLCEQGRGNVGTVLIGRRMKS